MTPAWAMNPLMWPTFPPTRIVPPFSEIPARDDASPSMTIVPPRPDAPAHSEALPCTRTDPACRFSPTDQPVKPCTTTSGPSPRPPVKYPALPSMSIRTRLLRPTARLWRPRGSSTRGRHTLAGGLSHRVRIDIEGNAGYYTGGLGDGPDVVVHGFTGWSVGENLQAGSVRVQGNASECAGASGRS